MKNAILFFGQPRFIKHEQIQNFYKNLIQDYNCDVFCHAWHSQEEEYYKHFSEVKMDCRVEKDAIDIIKSLYDPKILVHEPSREFNFTGDLKKFVDEKFTNRTPWWSTNTYNNLTSQMYSIQKISRLFTEYKNNNNLNYKSIVLSRYDTIITDMPNLFEIDSNKLYLQNNHDKFPDMIFVFGEKFLDWTNNLYTDLLEDPEIYKKIWEPSGEALKYCSFVKRFSVNDLAPCKIYGHAIRNYNTRL